MQASTRTQFSKTQIAQAIITVRRDKYTQRTVEGFKAFIAYFFPIRFGCEFIFAPHHEDIIQNLVDIVNGKTVKLMVNMPPRYGKTELIIINFVAWCLAIDDSWRFLHLSYSKDLALDNSSQIKEFIELEEYQQLWPVELKEDSKAKGKWKTKSGGGLYATSSKGQVTGFGAGLTHAKTFSGAILTDDPLKTEDADSDVKRNDVNARYTRTIKSRKNNRHVAEVIVMQRIHDNDPCGYLDDLELGEWKLLKLQALFTKNGQLTSLWPHKHTVEELLKLQKQDKYTFNAQYQQNPVPDDGDYFKRDRVNFYLQSEVPVNLNCYGASDYAVTEDGGDFTEHGLFGVDCNDDIYVLDWWSGQTKADVWIETQLDLVRGYKPLIWAGETGPIKSSVEPWLKRRMRERRDYVNLEWLPHSTNNKEGNARSFQALWEAGRIHIPKDAPWADELLHQLTRFPRGKYDDKVDVCSLFARLISQIWAAHKPEQKEKPKPITDEPLRMADFEPSGNQELW